MKNKKVVISLAVVFVLVLTSLATWGSLISASTQVDITGMVQNNSKLTFSGTVTPADMLTFTVVIVDEGLAPGDITVADLYWIDQLDGPEADKLAVTAGGAFTLTLDMSKFIKPLVVDTTYTIRIGGDDVDVPGEYDFQITETSILYGGDINGDGWIDIDDLTAMLDASVFGAAVAAGNEEGDIDENGIIDVEDVMWLLNSDNFNRLDD